MEGPPLPVDSVRRPSYRPLPQAVPPPAVWGRRFPSQTLAEPSWSQAGISPLGSLPPRTLPPPKSWVQCLLSHSNASNEGPSRRPRCGQVGTGKGLVCSSLSSPSQVRGPPGQGGPGSPLRVSGRVCVWDFSFVSFTCSPPARTPIHPASNPLPRMSRAYLFSEGDYFSKRKENLVNDFKPNRFSFLSFFNPLYPLSHHPLQGLRPWIIFSCACIKIKSKGGVSF
uniref:Uncharacterized protein n=1 Tax=Molossus molossus TaxID=27622 RepID=A0A7J8BYL1_MOLMO|nr:hypothetical protein HJG59_010085 [Molossus molossus]